MGRYAVVDNDEVVNVVVCDAPEFAAEQGWVKLADNAPVGIGHRRKGKSWQAPEEPEPAQRPDTALIREAVGKANTVAQLRTALLTLLDGSEA